MSLTCGIFLFSVQRNNSSLDDRYWVAGLGIAYQAKPLVKASAKQSISNLGLDGILYLLGYSDKDIQALG